MKVPQITKSLKWIAIALVVGIVAACAGHRDGEKRADRMMDMIAYKLDFTDEQEALLGQVKDEVKLIREETTDQRHRQREELLTLFQADQLDVEQLRSLMEGHRQQKEEYIPRVMPLVVQLHASLSTEQKDKVVQYTSKWHK